MTRIAVPAGSRRGHRAPVAMDRVRRRAAEGRGDAGALPNAASPPMLFCAHAPARPSASSARNQPECIGRADRTPGDRAAGQVGIKHCSEGGETPRRRSGLPPSRNLVLLRTFPDFRHDPRAPAIGLDLGALTCSKTPAGSLPARPGRRLLEPDHQSASGSVDPQRARENYCAAFSPPDRFPRRREMR